MILRQANVAGTPGLVAVVQIAAGDVDWKQSDAALNLAHIAGITPGAAMPEDR
jgi:hypothetical protein